MLIDNLKSTVCIRPKDETTDFLEPIGKLFGENYHVVDGNDESHSRTIELVGKLDKTSLIVFLGHGMSSGLYSAATQAYKQKVFINSEHNELFKNQNAFLLACRSEQFINLLKGYGQIIGFGNIISSREEIANEAELTGEFRQIENGDIALFNKIYVNAISNTFKLFLSRKISYEMMPKYISFYINKEINNILMHKRFERRIALSRLLFEFRNEMRFASGGRPQ